MQTIDNALGVASSFVWNFADIANALMAIPNLVSLILLSGVVVKETQSYLWSDRLDADAPEESTLG